MPYRNLDVIVLNMTYFNSQLISSVISQGRDQGYVSCVFFGKQGFTNTTAVALF